MRALAALTLSFLAPALAAQSPSLLVFEELTNHQLAQQAALTISPLGTVVADSTTFSGLLATGTWDAVVVDCPTCCPAGGWADLVNYVNGGGRVVMSFWDWDDDTLCAGPALASAFEVAVAASLSMDAETLFDSGASSIFSGVTMPNADWHPHWTDDGDEFTLQGTAVGLAHIGDPTTPVIALGNGGRTIAAPLVDVAGDIWLGDGSAVRVWENMIGAVLGGLPAAATVCGCGVNPPGSMSVLSGLPSVGTTVTLGLDNPAATQAVGSIPFLVLAFAPDAAFPCGTAIPGFGMTAAGAPGELLIDLAPPTPIVPILIGAPWQGAGTPAPLLVGVPNDPALLGVSVFAQGLLLDPTLAFGVKFGLTDAVRLRVGL